MSRPSGVGFLANSLSNLLVGAAAMGYAVMVPAVVVRRFGAAEYGTWFLAFQIAAYVLLLDLGSQVIVTKEATNQSPEAGAARFTTAAMMAQLGLALAVVALAVGWAEITGQPQLARLVTILGTAATMSLAATTVRAWFGGLQRSHVVAVWLVAARVGAVAGLGLALVVDAGLVTLTIAVALPQLVVHACLLLWARRAPSPWARPDREAFARLVRRTSPLAAWTVAGIFIVGVDIFVVRAVDPGAVGRYAVALPLLAVPTGIVTAAMAAWIPRVTLAESVGEGGGRDLTLAATGLTAASLSVGAIIFVAYADDLVRLWAGEGDWAAAATYLRILYFASSLRFVFLPWSVLVVVRGEQGSITLAPVMEAATNLVASIALGIWLGATGVAIGTLVGTVVAASLYLLWAIPRTSGSGVTTTCVLRAGVQAWLPLAASIAVAALAIYGAPGWVRIVAALTAVGVDGAWILGRLRRPAVDADVIS